MNYYVQEIAVNYLKNLTDEPGTMKVHPSFLYGAYKEQFREGFLALHRLMKSLYADIIKDPAGFGMLLKEIVEPNAKNADYTNSGGSFVRVPNLLFALGAAGILRPDFSLEIDGAKLLAIAKTLKITSLPLLLRKLGDYGLVTDGADKTVKESDLLIVAYPDSHYLPVALKAMAEATLILNKGDIKKSKAFFYILHSGLLEKEKVTPPKLTAGAVFHTLDEARRKTAETLHDTVASGSKLEVRMGGLMRNDWSCVYTGTGSKKVLMSLKTEQDRLDAKLNLQNIGKYIDTVKEFPEAVFDIIRDSGWECGHCHDSCAGGFAFELEGKAYNKCRCGAFYFADIAPDAVPYCQTLLEKEMAY